VTLLSLTCRSEQKLAQELRLVANRHWEPKTGLSFVNFFISLSPPLTRCESCVPCPHHVGVRQNARSAWCRLALLAPSSSLSRGPFPPFGVQNSGLNGSDSFPRSGRSSSTIAPSDGGSSLPGRPGPLRSVPRNLSSSSQISPNLAKSRYVSLASH